VSHPSNGHNTTPCPKPPQIILLMMTFSHPYLVLPQGPISAHLPTPSCSILLDNFPTTPTLDMISEAGPVGQYDALLWQRDLFTCLFPSVARVPGTETEELGVDELHSGWAGLPWNPDQHHVRHYQDSNVVTHRNSFELKHGLSCGFRKVVFSSSTILHPLASRISQAHFRLIF